MKKNKIIVGLLLAVMGMSCTPKLTKTANYQTAIKELSHHDFADNYILLSRDELKEKKYLLYNSDTIILSKSMQTFGFRNVKSKKIFVYQFAQISEPSNVVMISNEGNTRDLYHNISNVKYKIQCLPL